MNYRLYSHLYLHLKDIFTLKKPFTFARETRQLICCSRNVRKTPEEERNFKKRIYIFT